MARLLVRGVTLHYQDEGEGPPVLLLHGLGNSGQDWEFQVPALRRAGYRLIRPDLLGFGHSGLPESGYGPEDMASDMRALLTHLGVERAHLVGYSMGGAVAYQLAVDEPRRWLSLAIINSVPSFVPQRLYDHWQFWLRHVLSRVLGMQRMAEMVTKRLFLPDHPELAELMLPRYANNDVRVYGSVLAALSGWDIRDQLSQIACPVLVMAAEQDYFRLEDVEESLAFMDGAELQVVPGTRHGLPMERPELVNQALLRLFSRSSSA